MPVLSSKETRSPVSLHLSPSRCAVIALAGVALVGTAAIPGAGAAPNVPTLTPEALYVPQGGTVVIDAVGCPGAAKGGVAFIMDFGGPLENVVHTDEPLTVAPNGSFQGTMTGAFTSSIPNGTVLTIFGKCGVFSDQIPESAAVHVTIGPAPATTTTTAAPTTTTTKAPTTTTTAAPTTTSTTAPAAAAPAVAVNTKPAFTG